MPRYWEQKGQHPSTTACRFGHWTMNRHPCDSLSSKTIKQHRAQTRTQKEMQHRAKPFLNSTLLFANSLKSFLTTEVQETDLEIKVDDGHSAGDSIILGELPLGVQQESLENLLVIF